MQFLLDANVLIDAARDYYPFEMVPEFWAWLAHNGAVGNVKIPLEMYEEVCDGNDRLAERLREPAVKSALLLAEEIQPDIVSYAAAEAPCVRIVVVLPLG